MNNGAFDTLNQRTIEGVSRRRSLLALGATGIATLTGQFTAEGKKKGGKNKNKNKVPRVPLICPSPPEDPCPGQAEQCVTIVSLACEGSTTCQAQVDCCSFLRTCDANGFFACLAAT